MPPEVSDLVATYTLHACVQCTSSWLMEWHDVREHAIVISGRNPRTLIDPITLSELNAYTRDYVLLFPGQVRDHPHRGSDAYAVLTMCRALHTKLMGATATKRAAAEWVAREYPQWRDLIIEAQQWRLAYNDAINTPEVHAEVQAFVDFTVRTLR